MNITRVQVHVLNEPENKVKAYADIIIDNDFIVRGLAIREDHEGFCFVTMPYRINKNNNTRMDVAHPINEPCRWEIQTRVLDEYERVLNIIARNRPIQQEGSVIKPDNPYRTDLEGFPIIIT